LQIKSKQAEIGQPIKVGRMMRSKALR